MDEPKISDEELKAILAYHVRQKLDEQLIRGTLPESLAKRARENPAAIVDTVVAVLASAANQRTASAGEAIRIELPPKNAANLSAEDLALVMTIIFAAQLSQSAANVDMDMDGAILFCKRGNNSLQSQRFSDAKRFFQRAVQIKDTLKPAWEGLAEAQKQLGETQGAEESLRRARLL